VKRHLWKGAARTILAEDDNISSNTTVNGIDRIDVSNREDWNWNDADGDGSLLLCGYETTNEIPLGRGLLDASGRRQINSKIWTHHNSM
jgi:hypothetical protein